MRDWESRLIAYNVTTLLQTVAPVARLSAVKINRKLLYRTSNVLKIEEEHSHFPCDQSTTVRDWESQLTVRKFLIVRLPRCR